MKKKPKSSILEWPKEYTRAAAAPNDNTFLTVSVSPEMCRSQPDFICCIFPSAHPGTPTQEKCFQALWDLLVSSHRTVSGWRDGRMDVSVPELEAGVWHGSTSHSLRQPATSSQMLSYSDSQRETSPHFMQSICWLILNHCRQLKWSNASQHYACSDPPLRNTFLGSYLPFRRQPLLLDAHSSFQGSLEEVGSYLQLRGRWHKQIT